MQRGFIFLIAALKLGAQAQIQTNVIYDCSPSPERIKVLSCAGSADDSVCEIQNYVRAQLGPREKMSRKELVGTLRGCRVQTGADAQADARVAAPQTSNGIKVGDSVEVLTGFGWTPARVIAIQGNNYKVNVNGVQVVKTYPNEVRRQGALAAQDHAAGQYRVGDRVQVLVEGRWIESKIVTEMGREYQVQLPGNRLAWTGPQNLRPSTAPPPTSSGPVKAGTPPKQGLVSCGNKFDGRWASGTFGNFTIRFHGGKAMVTYMGVDDEQECWMGGGKIILHKPGDPTDVPIDINDDGSLSTPLWGDLRRKGN
jgi:hypothetical protein